MAEAEANARLIAAAPDLYEALKAVERDPKAQCDHAERPCNCSIKAVRAALAKATQP